MRLEKEDGEDSSSLWTWGDAEMTDASLHALFMYMSI